MILSIALITALAALASDSDKPFHAGPAGDYAHQTSQQITVGAKAYDSEELTAQAFGKKADLLKYGVVPILVVVENKRATALDLRDVEVSLVATDGRHAEPVRPEDIPFLARHARRPSVTPYPPIPMPKKKNPLNVPELVVRAFAAKVIPPGDSASGFFYFEARPEAGDKLYVNGVRDARTQEEILYFEFPLDK